MDEGLDLGGVDAELLGDRPSLGRAVEAGQGIELFGRSMVAACAGLRMRLWRDTIGSYGAPYRH